MQLNELTGQIPESSGFLNGIQELFLYNNSLTGPIPPAIFNISSFQRCHSSLNREHVSSSVTTSWFKQLNRELPFNFFSISSLTHISLGINRFSGNLPKDICFRPPNLEYLEYLELQSNQIYGNIPSRLSLCSALYDIALSTNYLTGTFKLPPISNTYSIAQVGKSVFDNLCSEFSLEAYHLKLGTSQE
ncbi:hypothetical protein ACH5RR_028614 [Cinchona calisaya]|uniref:Non-specific serine/threonine protein kinase n=1 Tax=Cinchona calisaya TaxID=153742 RepID=A0ABD2YQI6_9GENT